MKILEYKQACDDKEKVYIMLTKDGGLMGVYCSQNVDVIHLEVSEDSTPIDHEHTIALHENERIKLL